MVSAPIEEDFMPGDPALRVVGRSEKPARRHAPLPPKPSSTKVKDARQIRRDMLDRMGELVPVLEEVKRLERALEALSKIK